MLELALYSQVLIFLAVLGCFLASGQASVFHPATSYLGFHGLVFVLRPLQVHFLDYDSIWNYIGFRPDDSDMILALAVSSLALIVFVASSIYFGWTNTWFSTKPAASLSPLQYRALVWTTMILLPYIVASIATTQGGAEAAGERADNGVFIQTHSTGWLNDAQHMLAPMLCIWLVVTRFHWLNFPPILLYVAYRSWTGWSRWTIIMFFVMVTFSYCWQQRRRWPPLWSILLAIPILMLFSVLGHNRDVLRNYFTGGQNEEVVKDLRQGMTPEEKEKLRYDTQNFANFDYLTFVVRLIPKRSGEFTYGLQYVQLFTEPVPRILWKGKPNGSPVHLFDVNSYGNFLGLTFSLPGDGWMSGGWIGVVITLGIVGWIQGSGHRYFFNKVNEPFAALFYISGLAMVTLWFRDGGISIFKFLLWTWLPFFIWRTVIWVLGGRRLPGNSIIIRPGERLRMVQGRFKTGPESFAHQQSTDI